MFRILTLAVAALALLSTPALAKLSPAESRMIGQVDAEQARTLAMLEKWVTNALADPICQGIQKVIGF